MENKPDIIFRPTVMNIELTTKCPLHCPQCYCTLDGGKDIDFETAVHWLNEGKKAGVKEVMLSGGETLCYPRLLDLITEATHLGINSNVALSGVGFSKHVLDKLIDAGVGGIFISLNGSTEEINSQTRDGYQYAIDALGILKESNYPHATINWVMHRSNSDDFINIIHLANDYMVEKIVVLGVKPDSKHTLSTIPTKEQIKRIKKIMLSESNGVKILVESCFSPLLTYVCDTRLFGNMNVGKNRGCGAGTNSFSVNVDGLLSPCRHLDYYEKVTNLAEYAQKSKTIQRLQEMMREKPEGSCANCRFNANCIPCAAINSKLNGSLYRGFENCPVFEPFESKE